MFNIPIPLKYVMKTTTKKWILFCFVTIIVVIWIIWTTIFPLFIDERLFLMGDLAGIPILNPFYGLSIPVSILLIVLLVKQFIKIRNGGKNSEEES